MDEGETAYVIIMIMVVFGLCAMYHSAYYVCVPSYVLFVWFWKQILVLRGANAFVRLLHRIISRRQCHMTNSNNRERTNRWIDTMMCLTLTRRDSDENSSWLQFVLIPRIKRLLCDVSSCFSTAIKLFPTARLLYSVMYQYKLLKM